MSSSIMSSTCSTSSCSSDRLFNSITFTSCIGTLHLLRAVGSGASSTVYSSRSESGAFYALKAVRGGSTVVKQRQKVLKEVHIHSLVSSHPNVIPLLDVLPHDITSEDEECPLYSFLVLPYATSGDLYSLITDGKTLNNPTLIRSTFLQILNALDYCHSQGVFHRDIKGENILVFDGGDRVMLGDFGLATTQVRSSEWTVGTLNHMSPECIGGAYKLEDGYSSSANDVWSLGTLLVNLLTGRNPWAQAAATDVSFVKYCKGPSTYLSCTFPLSSKVNDILRNIFVAEDHRPDVAAIISDISDIHDWYNADAVFEKYWARWREPEDCTGPDNWIIRKKALHAAPDMHHCSCGSHYSNPNPRTEEHNSPTSSTYGLVRWCRPEFLCDKAVLSQDMHISSSLARNSSSERGNHLFPIHLKDSRSLLSCESSAPTSASEGRIGRKPINTDSPKLALYSKKRPIKHALCPCASVGQKSRRLTSKDFCRSQSW